ncbi:hypothetical protein [Azomonas macrocytogenes]|uniref:Putative RNase H-like nuclease (RuvC/YqgF family) n=1 Tax=Azomonas macrocytogenes TaxID=69962 RepID=A0A839T4T3_AZOMA|nr:hypothetical protein [Azomonas macrocytogenes]MBB3103770.1 putative RNase H-like nuclease (RuvC/YqgF family) [Azomonas macrocytogenes]
MAEVAEYPVAEVRGLYRELNMLRAQNSDLKEALETEQARSEALEKDLAAHESALRRVSDLASYMVRCCGGEPMQISVVSESTTKPKKQEPKRGKRRG